jgi:predicted transcriptional regulator
MWSFAYKEVIAMEIQLGVIEARYADMIWENEPVTSSELVKMTAVEFNWKRTTAHNVLRRLIDKGLFQNNNGLVTSVISREEFYSKQSKQYVEDTFAGSLPAFIAAFTQNSKLTQQEAEAIRRMIDRAEEK